MRLSPALVDRLVGSPTTARNWTTVLAGCSRKPAETVTQLADDFVALFFPNALCCATG